MLEVKNLTFQVQENGVERSIVENISFDVADGEMLVITGPNGGGKSTLAKVLMGIEKASAGQIILDGEDISNYDKEQKIFSTCAGAAIYRKKYIDRIGDFDEEHFAYLEDLDIGYRARICGYQNWYAPKAKVYHVGTVSYTHLTLPTNSLV